MLVWFGLCGAEWFFWSHLGPVTRLQSSSGLTGAGPSSSPLWVGANCWLGSRSPSLLLKEVTPGFFTCQGSRGGQSGSRKASWGPDVRAKQQCVLWLKARPPRWWRGSNTAQGCVCRGQRALGLSLQRISPVSGLSYLSSRQIRTVDISHVEPGFSCLDGFHS